MKIIVACLLALALCSCKQCSPVTERPVSTVERQEEVRRIIRNHVGRNIDVPRGPLSAAEVEKEMDKDKSRRLTIAPEWQQLKARFKPGDEFYYYTTDRESWGLLLGSAGYVLIRGNTIVGSFVTDMN